MKFLKFVIPVATGVQMNVNGEPGGRLKWFAYGKYGTRSAIFRQAFPEFHREENDRFNGVITEKDSEV